MRKFFLLGTLLASAGCAQMNPFAGPPMPGTPATPVFFQPFSTSLDQPALSTIAQAAQLANAQPDAPVTVTGAADNVGTTAANVALSRARANVVAAQLVADGVAAGRIQTHAIGETGAPGNMAQAARRAVIRIGG